MKKIERRFTVVPVEEALKNARRPKDEKIAEKMDKKEEPYAVPAPDRAQNS